MTSKLKNDISIKKLDINLFLEYAREKNKAKQGKNVDENGEFNIV